MISAEQRIEYIDKYLTGEISSKSELERLLLPPDASLTDKQQLEKEVEMQKEIIMAICSRGLREMLQKEEKQQKEEEHQRIVRLWRNTLVWTGGGLAAFSAAAAIALLLIVTPLKEPMYQQSDYYAMQLESAGELRGEERSLDEAYLAISNNDWQRADEIACNIMHQTPRKATEEQQETYQEAQWIHAQYLMHSGSTLRAYRLLHKIAKQDGYYGAKAQDVLDNLRNQKENTNE